MTKEQTNCLELIEARNKLYEKQEKSLVLSFLLLVIILITFVVYWFLYSKKVAEPVYFATTEDGQVIYDPPLSKNHLALNNFGLNKETGQLVERSSGRAWPELYYDKLDKEAKEEEAIVGYWAEMATLQMFDLDYKNYRITLHKVRNLFTSNGYLRFIRALEGSRNIVAIKQKRYVSYAVLDGRAKIIRHGVHRTFGRYIWQVHVPIVVVYENPNKEDIREQVFISQLHIGRVSTLMSPRFGLQIYRNNVLAK